MRRAARRVASALSSCAWASSLAGAAHVTPVASRTAPLPLAACAVARSAVRSLLPPAAGGLRSPADGPSRRLASASASPAQPPALPACYTRLDARVEAPFQLAPRDVFAVVQAGSHQFKVTLDDLVYVERVPQLDINDTVSLSRVLLLGSTSRTVLGRPFVPGASVTCVCEEQVRDAKLIVFKKRRRKNSRRTNGHRQQLTALRVIAIDEAPLSVLL